MNRDFVEMLRALIEAGAEFLVVGAHAMAVHGVPRATGDFDIWLRPSRENAERIFKALHDFGAPMTEHGITIQDFEAPDTVYQIGLPPRRIDLMTGISGVDFDTAWKSRIIVILEGHPIPVIGRSELIQNKRASGRTKDLVDLEILESDQGSRRGD